MVLLPANIITALPIHKFNQPVYFAKNDFSFPVESIQEEGFFASIADTVGDATTFKITTKLGSSMLAWMPS